MQLHHDPDPNEAFRDACAARVDDSEVFEAFYDLPERMQSSFLAALRNGDTDENNREDARVIRAAFDRALSDTMSMRIEEMKKEH